MEATKSPLEYFSAQSKMLKNEISIYRTRPRDFAQKKFNSLWENGKRVFSLILPIIADGIIRDGEYFVSCTWRHCSDFISFYT